MLRVLPIALLLACGGAPKKPAESRATTSVMADAIAAAASGKVAPGTAVVTFAVFLDTDPPTDPAKAVGRTALPLSIVAAPVDNSLPLDLPGLKAAVPAIGEPRSVVFVRYAGDRQPALAHVRTAAEAALSFGGTIVDLGTRRGYTADTLRAFLQSPDWAAEQIVVEAQKDDAGMVLFVTYGMARLGLPDLELSGIQPPHARLAFGAFQKVLHTLQTRRRAAPGDTVEGATLRECLRPPKAYEQTCVRM